MELAHAPRLVRRRVGDVEPCMHTSCVGGVDVIHPKTHPYTFVDGVIFAWTAAGRTVWSFATTALPVSTEEDFALAATDGAECRRRTPLPALVPPELFKPFKCRAEIRDIEDRREMRREE